ncbi:transmembrane protein 45B-like protein, partial [Dinothrombium tinctorium]
MGTFLGHIIPGTFFSLFAVRWLCLTFDRYFKVLLRKQYSQECSFRCTATYGCSYCPNKPCEGYLKIVAALFGMISEIFTAFKHGRFTEMGNLQHTTMYFFFGFNGFVDVLTFHRFPIPDGADYLTLAIACFVEASLFYFHLHLHTPLELIVHKLLLIAIVASLVSCLIELRYRNNVLSAIFRSMSALLQGTWFYQVGFILYNPIPGAIEWKTESHYEMMLITAIFCWHIAGVMLFTMSIGFIYYFKNNLHYFRGKFYVNGRNNLRLSEEANDNEIDLESLLSLIYSHSPISSNQRATIFAESDASKSDDLKFSDREVEYNEGYSREYPLVFDTSSPSSRKLSRGFSDESEGFVERRRRRSTSESLHIPQEEQSNVNLPIVINPTRHLVSNIRDTKIETGDTLKSHLPTEHIKFDSSVSLPDSHSLHFEPVVVASTEANNINHESSVDHAEKPDVVVEKTNVAVESDSVEQKALNKSSTDVDEEKVVIPDEHVSSIHEIVSSSKTVLPDGDTVVKKDSETVRNVEETTDQIAHFERVNSNLKPNLNVESKTKVNDHNSHQSTLQPESNEDLNSKTILHSKIRGGDHSTKIGENVQKSVSKINIQGVRNEEVHTNQEQIGHGLGTKSIGVSRVDGGQSKILRPIQHSFVSLHRILVKAKPDAHILHSPFKTDNTIKFGECAHSLAPQPVVLRSNVPEKPNQHIVRSRFTRSVGVGARISL